ncbi:uncharacterized protein LOC135340631 [Halichondria panicea]|uniref:uncharacterized protein LOC135340631 n=1 Tax=Halichondria panicea TaxID=6063 RepID=UPI00312B6DD4
MEKKLLFRSLATSHITAVIYQPLRREVVAGHEDGSLRCWEQDTGKLVSLSNHHKGRITDLLFWPEGKTMFSAAIDYTVVQWSPAGTPFNTIDLGSPIHCLTWNPRKDGLLCGRDGYISLLTPSGKNSTSGNPLLSRRETRIEGHSGIVKCLVSLGTKVYSAGYDNMLVVWEVSTMPGDQDSPLRALVTHTNAHDAGITTLIVAKDADSSTWLATGSFDGKCKLWTGDGKLMFQVQCSGPVTGLCQVPHTGVLWVAAGSSVNYYEPKSGECITDVVPILNNQRNLDKPQVQGVQLLKYIPEANQVIGSTHLKEVVVWAYTPSCSVCVHPSPSPHAHIETIAYTNKRPILLFTGTSDGLVTKWDRLQLNPFMYSTEQLHYKARLASHLVSEEAEWNLIRMAFGGDSPTADKGQSQPETKEADRKLKERARKKLLEADYRGFVCSMFVEELDYVVCSCLDGRIVVWGYDMSTVRVLSELQRKARELANGHKETIGGEKTSTEDPVINRVAGFMCMHILNGHTGCGSGLELVEHKSKLYLVSSGWDCAVCVWDLTEGQLLAKLQHTDTASDDIITCLAYSPTTDSIAYSMSNCIVYLRQFSTRQSEMKLTGKLEGHTGEVTQVRWNSFTEKWVTGSEDGTIKIWRSDGQGECEQLVSVGGPVSFVTIDKKYGFILAAIHNVIRVYNTDLELLQVCRGHEDSVRAVLHIPENDQYVTAGWDKTLRLWSAYQPRTHTS